MRARCPKCTAVFEVAMGISIIHAGPWRYTKCPACGKRGIMNNFVTDPVTWPKQEEGQAQPTMSEEELMKKRLEDSKYEEKGE